jgi:colanic acid biosynthesis glycosyl transferase WcaI
MHILFLTDNFPPEGNAPASRTFEHTKEWVKTGHKVTVITTAPNFPEGKVYDGYKNLWLDKDVIDGIGVWRVKTYISANEGFFRRSLDFASFMFASFFFGLFVKKPDIIVGTSPQFFTVISACFLSKIKKVPFVFELRDIWPASIVAVSATNNRFLIRILEKIEIFLYKSAALIIAVTQSFKTDLVKRGIPPEKIEIVFNGANLSKLSPTQEKNKEFLSKYNLSNKFIAGYIGTHGLAHSLETIVLAADSLKSYKDLKIILAGGGSEKLKIEKLIKKYNLENIELIPRQPKEKMKELWSICDLSIITLKNDNLFRTVIPSKIFESMAMRLPIIISVPRGEATEIVASSESGIIVPPEKHADLAEAILKLYKDQKLLKKLSENSYRASKLYDREKLANEMLKYITKLIK